MPANTMEVPPEHRTPQSVPRQLRTRITDDHLRFPEQQIFQLRLPCAWKYVEGSAELFEMQ